MPFDHFSHFRSLLTRPAAALAAAATTTPPHATLDVQYRTAASAIAALWAAGEWVGIRNGPRGIIVATVRSPGVTFAALPDLAAFHAALHEVGLGLIELPTSRVSDRQFELPRGEFKDLWSIRADVNTELGAKAFSLATRRGVTLAEEIVRLVSTGQFEPKAEALSVTVDGPAPRGSLEIVSVFGALQRHGLQLLRTGEEWHVRGGQFEVTRRRPQSPATPRPLHVETGSGSQHDVAASTAG